MLPRSRVRILPFLQVDALERCRFCHSQRRYSDATAGRSGEKRANRFPFRLFAFENVERGVRGSMRVESVSDEVDDTGLSQGFDLHGKVALPVPTGPPSRCAPCPVAEEGTLDIRHRRNPGYEAMIRTSQCGRSTAGQMGTRYVARQRSRPSTVINCVA